MPNEDRISAVGHPLVAALLEERLGPGLPVSLDIARGDEMLDFLVAGHAGDLDRGLVAYFADGLSVWHALAQVVRWHCRDLTALRRVLDYASGWGRVSRFLVREMEAEKLWVSDLQEGAAEFQRDLLGVQVLESADRPETLECHQRFDAIFVTSLFSHLPEDSFRAWFERLIELLEPGGLLVFSVHDLSLLEDHEPRPESGFLFRRVSESRCLDLGSYGTTWVSEDYVRTLLAAGSDEISGHRIPRGLSNFQDLWVVVRDPDADFEGLTFHGEARGFLETCFIDGGGRLAASGWASPMTWDRPIEAVEIVVGDEEPGRAQNFSPRPEVAKALKQEEAYAWSCTAPMPRVARRSQLPIIGRIVFRDGRSQVFHVSSLEGALWTSELRSATSSGAKLRAARGYLDVLSKSADYHVEVLEARLAAMEGSAFWRLRNAWFRLKQRLGLAASHDSWPDLPPWRKVRGKDESPEGD